MTEELDDANPRWLRTISRGVNLILLSILLIATLPFLGEWVNDRFFLGWRSEDVALGVSLGICCLVLVMGVFLLTCREGYAPADRASRRRRRILRINIVVPVLALLTLMFISDWSFNRYHSSLFDEDDPRLELLSIGCATVVIVGAILLPLPLFFHLRALARRARIADLMEYSAIVAVGGSLLALGTACLLWYMNSPHTFRSDYDFGSESWGMMMLQAVLFSTAAAFMLWGLFLLVYFAIAFRRAIRGSRRKWIRDDRSMENR